MTHYPDLNEYPKVRTVSYIIPRSIAEVKADIEKEFPGCSYVLTYQNGYEKTLARAKKPNPKIVTGVEIVIEHPSFWEEKWNPEPLTEEEKEFYRLKDSI